MPEPDSDEPSALPRAGLLALGVALVAFCAMLPAFDGPFIYDDLPLIEGNHYVQSLEHWREWLRGGLWNTNYDVGEERRSYFRPFVVASYALDWWWGGGAPFAFHVTNAALHGLSSALLFRVLRGWLCTSPANATARDGAALLGALVFALHPVQTECAAWISGRTDVLAANGLLLATLALRLTRRRPVLGTLAQAAALLFAFGSKEIAVVFPLLAAVELWSRREASARPLGRIALQLLPYVVLSLGCAAGYAWLDRERPPSLGLTATNHLPLVAEAYGRYFSLMAWPEDLSFGRALLRIEDGAIAPNLGYVAVGCGGLFGLVGLACHQRRRRPLAALGALTFVAALIPVSGLVWLGYSVLVSPRFLYVPAFGFCAALAAVLGELRGVRTRFACVALLAALGGRTLVRATDYASSDTFWRKEWLANPSYVPALEYFVSRELQAGRPSSAFDLARRSLTPPPGGFADLQPRATLLLKSVAGALAFTPDLDRTTLEGIQRFATGLLAGQPVPLTLPATGFELDLRAFPRLIAELGRSHRTLSIMAAESAVRLGDDAFARQALTRALDGCEECWTLLTTSALLAARASDFPHAIELARRAQALSPPDKAAGLLALVEQASVLHRRFRDDPTPRNAAAFHASLGSYGRAYAAARDVLRDPPREPGALRALAELAYQAGDVSTARRLLQKFAPGSEVERHLARLATHVRWRDRPRDPNAWLPAAS